MSFRTFLRRLAVAARRDSSVKPRRGAAPALERLEDRTVPYAVTGNAWPHAQLITLSFMPDGTSLGGTTTSNLQATFNANPYLNQTGAANWRSQILKAAQVWAQQANINFAVVGDNGAASGSGSNEQGDPGFGDIRVGGYNFGNSALASAYQPPGQNNYSIAGDIVFNTGQTWSEGRTYDLFTVAMHEFGHALGLDHSSSSTSNVMYPSYTAVKSGLAADDISGIKAVYGANTPDAYLGSNNSIAAAANVGSFINSSTLTALVPDLQLMTPSTPEDFMFQAPAGTSGTMKVQVQSQGLSLLTPVVTVYAADGVTILGSASGLNQYGTTLTVSVSGVTAGQKYYVQVKGADTTAFGTGSYALALNFGTGATPTEAPPVTTTANASPLSGSGGCANSTNPNGGDIITDSVPTVTGITPDTGSSSTDGITRAQNISILGTASPDASVQVYSLSFANGTYTVQGLLGTATQSGLSWTFNDTGTTLAPGTYYFGATTTDSAGNVSGMSYVYTVVIDTAAPAAPGPLSYSTGTGASTPTVSGTAAAYTSVTVYRTNSSGVRQVAAVVPATAQGAWSFTEGTALANGSYSYTAVAVDAAGNVSATSGALKVSLRSNTSSSTGSSTTNSTTIQQSATLASATLSSGVVYSGGVTATPNPSNGTWTLSGQGAAGHSFVIMNGTTALGTAVVGSNGLWSVTVGPLPSGQNVLNVFDVDALGDATLVTALTISA